MSRFAMRRKTGFISVYSLSMFYGTYRASLYFKNSVTDPVIRFGKKWYSIPKALMVVFRPFNTYRQTMRGERFY